ncbi:MAG TPA: FAD-dependent oxidoreductase, partial [Acidimicrobiales bacterium]|nr:FAD-dependent oxidoreductase [Acidimicrobiales bacterium]
MPRLPRRAVPRPAAGTFDRAANLRRLADEEFDVVVVGGGITGCGVALDAAARGLRAALVEAEDFASGTSSRSSKLVHGGLRYLNHREFHLVYEALAERQRLLRNAPHLVRPLPFVIPLFGREGVVAAGVARAYSTALWLYDLTGGLRIGRRHRRITADEARARVPGLRAERLAAAFLYWDAQADDARLTLAVARTAAALGAAVVNRAPVAALLREPGPAGASTAEPARSAADPPACTAGPAGPAPDPPDPAGRVAGVRLADGTEVRARVVVNAGGVWSEVIGHLPGG